MPKYIVAYIAAAVVFCVFDFVWLTILAKDFYKSQIGALMLEQPNLAAAAIFYLLYLVGLLVFAVMPAINAQNWLVALGLGAFFGLIAYATYDLSNLATLKSWSVSLALVDIAWGAFVSGTAASVAYFAQQRFS